MATIHVNTDVMRQLAQAYLTWNNTLQSQMLPQLQSLIAQLEGDWIGSSRQDYDNQLQSWQQSLNSLITAGQNLGNHVLNTANQFDMADRS
jgi:WXG100 family type VII secretion target